MSEAARKTFKVVCPHVKCKKPFHVRFPLAQPDAPGDGEVAVTCMYCTKQVMVTLPRMYIEAEALTRGLSSRAVEG